jgi:predicted Zn finger-like uncharacterized protein
MKITCQSCQSKYNVADEKVEGKIVKIRCRKCGATIVVNGTHAAATNGTTEGDTKAQEDTAAAGDDAQWHVNVGDNDQRTMTLAEVVEAYNAGIVTQETFIWSDGMDDWRPLGEVVAVVAALRGSAPAPPLAEGGVTLGSAGAAPPPAAAAPEARAAATYEAPAADAPAYEPAPAYVAPPPEPKRAAVAKRETRARDLFATSTGGEELITSAPVAPEGMAPALDASSPTGQRNENSVLFSLAVLTKNADARPVSRPPVTSREDSGLIDLKALAQKAESMRPLAMGDSDVFHAPLGLTPTPLGAPLGELGDGHDAQPKSKLPLLIGGGAGVLLLLVLGIVIGVKLAGSPAPVPAPTVASTATATAEPSASAAAPPPATTETATSPAPSGGSVAALKKPGPAVWHPAGGTGGAVVKPSSGSGGAAAPTPAPTPAPAPKKSGGDCGCNGDLMCLMKCSTH